MKHTLVFGGSGQIGRPLLARLLRDGWRLTALSREVHQERSGLTWLRGSFDALPALPKLIEALGAESIPSVSVRRKRSPPWDERPQRPSIH